MLGGGGGGWLVGNDQPFWGLGPFGSFEPSRIPPRND